MKLIDTSSWVEQLRRGGDETVRSRVEALLTTGEAAWCPVVRLELWNGARGDPERKVLRQMERDIPSLEIEPDVWDRATTLACMARERGITVPVTDLLVAACARHHGVRIEHNDNHLALIDTLSDTYV
jgi:predicted nucleic acid-binding protein